MRVLGIDPGLTRCGIGVVDSRRGRKACLVEVDVVRTPHGAGLDQRLLSIGTVLDSWLERHRPDVLAVERVFSQHNVRTVMGTAQVSGVAVLAAARRGVPVALHTPSEVKAAVTGSGRAGKAQVATMVRHILGLEEAPTPADAADALALAICHLWRAPAGREGGDVVDLTARLTPAQAAWAQAREGAAARAREARTAQRNHPPTARLT